MEIILVMRQRKTLYEATFNTRYAPFSESPLAQVPDKPLGTVFFSYTRCIRFKLVSLLVRSHREATQP